MTDTNVLPDLPHDVKEIPTLSSIDSTRLRNITRNYLINTETWNFGHFSRLVYQAPEFSGDNDQVRRRVSAKNLWEEALNDFANGSNGSLKQKAVNELLVCGIPILCERDGYNVLYMIPGNMVLEQEEAEKEVDLLF